MGLPDHLKLLDRLRRTYREPLESVRSSTVDAAFYRDQSWFEREQETLFKDQYQVVGHTAMIPEPGDHFAHDLSGVPLIVLRDHAGEVAAFLNVCRHRGVRLVNHEGCTRRKALVCPYHNWSYGLDGGLKKVPLPEAFPDLDMDALGLYPVPVTVRGGLIFAHSSVRAGAEPFAGVDGLVPDFEAFDFAGHHYHAQSTTLLHANWKLIVEAFQDGYHVRRLHAKSIGPMFMDSVADVETVGQNIRAVVARREFAEAGQGALDQIDCREHVTFAYLLFPNTIIIVHPDYLSFLSLHPQSPGETLARHICLVRDKPETEEEKLHWDKAFDIIDKSVFTKEDYFVCQSAQRGINAMATETLHFGGHERGVMIFHDILCAAMGRKEGLATLD